MAVTRRGYIFAAFLSSIASVLLIIVAVASDNWVESTASAVAQAEDSNFSYGLFRGELVFRLLATPTINTLYMTCLPDVNACAVSCKTEPQARQDEVRALAQGFRPNEACISVTDVSTENPLEQPPVISFALYVSVLVLLFLQLLFSALAAFLGVINATRNPTEPLCGLPGCLWSNVVSSILGLTALLTFGIYWAVSGLKEHLAFSYIALGQFQPDPSLGYSYWMLLLAVVCSLTNVCFIEMRRYLLERDPPPPTIKVENHSDGRAVSIWASVIAMVLGLMVLFLYWFVEEFKEKIKFMDVTENYNGSVILLYFGVSTRLLLMSTSCAVMNIVVVVLWMRRVSYNF